MANVKFQNGPWIGGWIIGLAMGVAAFAALKIVGGFDYMPAAYLGGVVGVLAGAVMGLPPGSISGGAAAEAGLADRVAAAAPAVAAAPAALMSTPSKAGPTRYDAPRGGKADNLQEIEGIGLTMEKLLNSLGFWHFDQLAGWGDADVAWVDENLKGFKGRVTRDKWVPQARIIMAEGLERFRERAKRNDY